MRPERLLGIRIPGLGVLLAFAILLVTGVFAANFFGARLISFWEGLLGRIPFVKSIYSASSRSATRCFPTRATRSARRCWCEFPHEHSWTIAFLTGSPSPAVTTHLDGEYL